MEIVVGAIAGIIAATVMGVLVEMAQESEDDPSESLEDSAPVGASIAALPPLTPTNDQLGLLHVTARALQVSVCGSGI